MTRKHFIAIAAAIRKSIIDRAQREAVAAALIPALRASNSNFNSEKFVNAAVDG
jgi:hypothetical protein